jgi:hypothetical protein
MGIRRITPIYFIGGSYIRRIPIKYFTPIYFIGVHIFEEYKLNALLL